MVPARIADLIPLRTYRVRGGIARGLKHRGRGLRQLIEPPRPDTPEIRTLRAQDLGGRTVYDIGADAGWFTSFFADRAGAHGGVIAFEPNPVSYERALEQVRINGQANVTVLNVAAGDEDGELTMAIGDQPGQGSADPEIRRLLLESSGVRTARVPVVRVDTAVRERGLPLPDFVKIDVEGFELPVLRGMAETLGDRHPALFIELHGADRGAKQANAAAVAELLLGHGYEISHVESDAAVATAADAPLEGHLLCR